MQRWRMSRGLILTTAVGLLIVLSALSQFRREGSDGASTEVQKRDALPPETSGPSLRMNGGQAASGGHVQVRPSQVQHQGPLQVVVTSDRLPYLLDGVPAEGLRLVLWVGAKSWELDPDAVAQEGKTLLAHAARDDTGPVGVRAELTGGENLEFTRPWRHVEVIHTMDRVELRRHHIHLKYPALSIRYRIHNRTGMPYAGAHRIGVSTHDYLAAFVANVSSAASGELVVPGGLNALRVRFFGGIEQPNHVAPLFGDRIALVIFDYALSGASVEQSLDPSGAFDALVRPHGDQLDFQVEATLTEVGLRMKLLDTAFADVSLGIVQGLPVAQEDGVRSSPCAPPEWINDPDNALAALGVHKIAASRHFPPLADFLESDGSVRHTRISGATTVSDTTTLGAPNEVWHRDRARLSDATRFYAITANGQNTLLPPVDVGGPNGDLRYFPLQQASSHPSVQIVWPAERVPGNLFLACEVTVRGLEQNWASGEVRLDRQPDVAVHTGVRWLDLRAVPPNGLVELRGLTQEAEWWPVGVVSGVEVNWLEGQSIPRWVNDVVLSKESGEQLTKWAGAFFPGITDVPIDESGHLALFPPRGFKVSDAGTIRLVYAPK